MKGPKWDPKILESKFWKEQMTEKQFVQATTLKKLKQAIKKHQKEKKRMATGQLDVYLNQLHRSRLNMMRAT